MGNIFFTSDNHFGHKNILKYCPGRGKRWSTVEEMDDGMRDLWNQTVKPGDLVYMLGDVAFWSSPERIRTFIRTLNGNKFLCLGNHDQNISKNISVLSPSAFVQISTYKEIKVTDKALGLDGHKVCLFHYSGRIWNKAHRGSWLLWGHSHGELEPYGRSVDVGVDSPWVTGQAEYRPFSLEEVAAFMKGRDLVEHHKVTDL